ncbi:MAG TPA: acylphosphatase [Candidatus Krumholzibacteria bacterium]|nr:acylphosphatase [Candidatus Krumholzibacteria bacterium]
MEQRVAFRALVSGRVQGVFFRDTTRRQAQSLGLSGWVRNLPDGRVEVCAIGPRAACESLLEFLRVGPPRASVSNVEARWETAPPSAPGDFEIR